MTFRDKILSGILLILIGVMLGMILMFFRQGTLSLDTAEVRFTEVNRSEIPLWSDEDLEKIDDRFLFRNVAKSVTPTVVYIETVVSTNNRRIDNNGDEENGFWQRFLPPRARTVGSGVVLTQDGYILTNNHVIEHAVNDGITITLNDKRSYDARVVGKDPSTDLAVLKVDAQNLTPAIIGNSDRIEVGEWVLAVGNPFRLRSTVTAGIVGAVSRDVQIINDQFRIESFIQTDAAINRGNSGGALVNTSGELIGINTAIATQDGNYQGYGFAVPSNLALKVATDIIEFGEVKRGLLGVSIQSVDDQMARRAGLETIKGVEILEVGSGSAADNAGIQRRDIVLEVNDESVNESNQLQEKVAMFRPGDGVKLTIWRDGETLDKTVVLDEMQRPAEPENTFDDSEIEQEFDQWDEIPENGGRGGIEQKQFDDIGLTIRALATPEDPNKFDLYIHRVQEGSVAWSRGVPVGAKIIEINNQQINSITEAEQFMTDKAVANNPLHLKVETEDGSIGHYKLF